MAGASLGGLRLYLADVHAEWLAFEPATRWRVVDGTLVFIDISGFTPLAERLSRRGKIGSEDLADVLNQLLGRLLAETAGRGGDCLKFGGDALLLLFTGTGHAARAADAAVGMVREVKSFRATGLAVAPGLKASVGLHSGPVFMSLAGDQFRDLVVWGPTLTEVLRLEQEAQAGQILTAGGLLLRRGGGRSAGGSGDRGGPALIDSAVLGGGLSPGLRRYLQTRFAGGEASDGEHRIATVGFLKFGGTDRLLSDHGPGAVADAIHELTCRVQAATRDHDVTFAAIDVDRDGGKFFLFAGVPVSAADDGDRMVHALRDVVTAGGGPLAVRAGVNRGRGFAVDLGDGWRRGYTVLGDTTNVAARVMGKATPGGVLATRAAVDRLHTDFELDWADPFPVKGKSHLVEAAHIGAARGLASSSTAPLPLVGRDREMAVIQEALGGLGQGRGSVVELVADAGLGKSRLVQAATVACTATGLPVVSLRGGRYSRFTGWYALRAPLAALVARAAGTEVDDSFDPIAALGRVAPDLAQWSPLIAPIWGRSLDDTVDTSRLDEAFRAGKLRSLLVDLLSRLVPGPALWVVEDAFWLDAASSELVQELMSLIEQLPWAFLVTRRPVPSGGDSGPIVPLHLGGTARLALEPLSPEAAKRLAEATLAAIEAEGSPATAAIGRAPATRSRVLEQIAERAGGNPLFVVELARAVARHGDADDLPDTVESVIAARIDTLDRVDRATVRQAAVLGPSFPVRILAGLLDTGPGGLRRSLAEDLGEFLGVDGDLVRFHHALLRDVAYESLSFRSRRAHHARSGEEWERQYSDDPEQVSEMLSLHFHLAGVFEKAYRYSRQAGRRADRAAAPVEAATFYRRALESAAHVPAVSEADQADVAERLGDMVERYGVYEEARSSYRLAHRLSADPLQRARVQRKSALAWLQQGRHPQGRRGVRRALSEIDSARRPVAAGAPAAALATERAKCLAVEGVTFLREGRYRDARPILHEAVRVLEDGPGSETRSALARAYRYLHWLYTEWDEPPPEPYGELCLALYEELGDRVGQCQALNNLGIEAYYNGDWERSVSLYERSRAEADQTGQTVQVALLLNNVAEIRSDQGRLREAEELLSDAFQIFRTAGHSFEGMVLSNQGRAAARAGRFEEAGELYDRAAEVLDRHHEVALLAEARARDAERHVMAGDPAEAVKVLATVPTLARGQYLPTTESLVERMEGYSHAQGGDLAGAWHRMSRAVIRSREGRDVYGAASAMAGLGRIAGARGQHEVSRHWLADSGDLFWSLGVISTPTFPLVPRDAWD
ncbi:MAG TPA: adenylate/guanylate cyclase domain-containing protein [Acidimicrobiales bacterium]|nr:adenylate/guanylate cyclase domain-containing protein [Acidimicrobiales bacterium]